MPLKVLTGPPEVVCASHPHDSSDLKTTMYKYDDDFVLQAIERSDPPFALRKQGLRLDVYTCKVCGYVELYGQKNHE